MTCCGSIGDVLLGLEDGVKVRFLKADPRSAISDELWDEIHTHISYMEHHDDVVTIWDDFGTQYIYRDLGHCDWHRWHVIEWPV